LAKLSTPHGVKKMLKARMKVINSAAGMLEVDDRALPIRLEGMGGA